MILYQSDKTHREMSDFLQVHDSSPYMQRLKDSGYVGSERKEWSGGRGSKRAFYHLTEKGMMLIVEIKERLKGADDAQIYHRN